MMYIFRPYILRTSTRSSPTEADAASLLESQFDALLTASESTDLTDLESSGVILTGQVDTAGRPLLIILGKNYDRQVSPPESLKLYIASILDRFGRTPYSVLYCHTGVTSASNPGLLWLLK